MHNPFQKPSDVLEKFRITAHLRCYVKDPIIIKDHLLQGAIVKLKKLPYDKKDPAQLIAKELAITAFCLGYYSYADLTEQGCQLVRQNRYRGYQFKNKMVYHHPMIKLRYQ
ncbi:MAG: hypothetical protein COB77_06635 [Gammaproteobacteria bacterium]|nr:MAG: hypothetical protein COB77_06635 [Gammaproteobacteria bacterium]